MEALLALANAAPAVAGAAATMVGVPQLVLSLFKGTGPDYTPYKVKGEIFLALVGRMLVPDVSTTGRWYHKTWINKFLQLAHRQAVGTELDSKGADYILRLLNYPREECSVQMNNRTK